MKASKEPKRSYRETVFIIYDKGDTTGFYFVQGFWSHGQIFTGLVAVFKERRAVSLWEAHFQVLEAAYWEFHLAELADLLCFYCDAVFAV